MKRFALAALVLALGACMDASTPVAPGGDASPGGGISASVSSGGVAREVIPGRYIVVFRNRSGQLNVDATAARVAGRHGARIAHVFHNALQGMTVTIPDAGAAALRADADVAYVEQDQVMRAVATQTGATWGIDRIDQRARPLSGTYVYNADGTGVTVYILDTGIRFTHTEFGGRAVSGYDAITSGGTSADCNGHGTHVAGTVGGTVYGVAKKARLVAVRVLDCSGSGSTTGVIAGIDWVTAQKNAAPAVPSAANMSLGGGLSTALNQAVARSTAAGVTYAVAAGNSSADACTQSPAAEPSAITVGATDINDGFASFSNYGSCVDLSAPGVSITSAWYTSNTATNTISGTSMASPHVAGTAALYLQVNNSATPAQVSTALTSNGTRNVITGLPAGTVNILDYSGFITAAPPGPPVARFTSSCSGLTCSFDASSSSAQAGATYSWAFGDATSGSGITTSHAYATAGTYTVTLTVTDAYGTSTATGTVSPTNPPPTPAPVANFTSSCTGFTCSFDASSSTAQANATYAWVWGDNTPNGSGKTASHTYPTTASATTYQVRLTVTDAGGSSSITKPVTVTPPPKCVGDDGEC